MLIFILSRYCSSCSLLDAQSVGLKGQGEHSLRDAFKKQNMGHCPKRWEGVQTGSQIFHIVQMGHKGVGGRVPNGNAPKFCLKED